MAIILTCSPIHFLRFNVMPRRFPSFQDSFHSHRSSRCIYIYIFTYVCMAHPLLLPLLPLPPLPAGAGKCTMCAAPRVEKRPSWQCGLSEADECPQTKHQRLISSASVLSCLFCENRDEQKRRMQISQSPKITAPQKSNFDTSLSWLREAPSRREKHALEDTLQTQQVNSTSSGDIPSICVFPRGTLNLTAPRSPRTLRNPSQTYSPGPWSLPRLQL